MSSRVSSKSITGIMLLFGVAGAAVLRGQDPRQAAVARAFREFDATRRLELLIGALNPTVGPPRGAWSVGAQLLAQTFIEDGQDSAAAVWLRWALRLAPDLQPDTVEFLPEVITAYRSARDFVTRTRRAADSTVATTWLWAVPAGGATPQGRLQIVASGPVPVRVEVIGIGPIEQRGDLTSTPIRLSPGSYQVRAVAGSDSARVTREVLPGITTVLQFRFRSVTTHLATKRPAPPSPRKKKGFPVVWAGVGAAGAVALTAFLVTMGSESPQPTGGIIVTFPGP